MSELAVTKPILLSSNFKNVYLVTLNGIINRANILIKNNPELSQGRAKIISTKILNLSNSLTRKIK